MPQSDPVPVSAEECDDWPRFGVRVTRDRPQLCFAASVFDRPLWQFRRVFEDAEPEDVRRVVVEEENRAE